jgi:hypothetical protein
MPPPRDAESKGAKILEMIGRAKGVSLAETMKATDWQPHSVRGFISTAANKHKVNIESAKNESGERVYRIPASSGRRCRSLRSPLRTKRP